MPRSMEQNEELRRQRRQQIIAAAFIVYNEKGLRAMEMGDVARQAAVGRGTVYHYYKNKQELLQDVFQSLLADTRANAAATLNSTQAPLLRLKAFFRRELAAHFEEPLRQRFFKSFFEDVQEVFGPQAPAVLAAFEADNYQPLLAAFKAAIADGSIRPMDVERLTHLFWGAFIGLPAFVPAAAYQSAPEDWLEDALALLFNGIVTAPSPRKE